MVIERSQWRPFWNGEYGRLRDVLVGTDGEVYIATSNRDRCGDPTANDDRILRLTAPIGR
jgi:glucose/arabinose dehydrogenase